MFTLLPTMNKSIYFNNTEFQIPGIGEFFLLFGCRRPGNYLDDLKT